MPTILFHEAKHDIKLFLGHLLKYGFIPLLKLFVQFLMDFVNYFPLVSKPKIDFFLVIRLLVAFDKAFFYELLSYFTYGAPCHKKGLRKFCHVGTYIFSN